MNALLTEVLPLAGDLVAPLPLCLWAGLVLTLLTGVGARLVNLIEGVGTRCGSKGL